MLFKCGGSIEVQDKSGRAKEQARWEYLMKKNASKVAANKLKKSYYDNWHPYYAWWPVRLEDDQCAWLQWVQRRYADTDVNDLYGDLYLNCSEYRIGQPS